MNEPPICGDTGVHNCHILETHDHQPVRIIGCPDKCGVCGKAPETHDDANGDCDVPAAEFFILCHGLEDDDLEDVCQDCGKKTSWQEPLYLVRMHGETHGICETCYREKHRVTDAKVGDQGDAK